MQLARYSTIGVLAAILTLGCSDATGPAASSAPSPAAPPPAAPPARIGTINLTVATVGVDIDPNGYLPRVDGFAADSVAVNGSVTIANLTIGSHLVRLDGVAMNCAVDGPTERSVDLTATSPVSVHFIVSCVRNGQLAFVDGNSTNIYVVNSDGIGASAFTSNQGYSDPAWSPDGSRIAFARYSEGDQDIYVMNANGTGVVRLTDYRGSDYSPAWAPDGARIAFVSEREGNAEIYAMNVDGSNVVRLTRDAPREGVRDADPTWSPDGSRIAFSRHDWIYVMNSDGSGLTRLTSDNENDRQPSWSSDGGRIAFSRQWASGKSAIFTIQPDGSDPTRVSQDFLDASDPAWSKDGRLAFATVAECHPVPWWFDECTGEILVLRPDNTTYYVTGIGLPLSPAWRP
jgi:tricorn protease-like protein